jgi:hypothetical protein
MESKIKDERERHKLREIKGILIHNPEFEIKNEKDLHSWHK